MMAPARRASIDPAGRSRDVDGALEVQVDHLVERLVAEQADDAFAGDAGVVDQDVDAAPPVGCLLDEAFRVGRVSHVGRRKWKRSLYSGSSSQALTVSVVVRAQVSTQ